MLLSSIKYTILDICGNINQIKLLKKYLQTDEIFVYTDIDKYISAKKTYKLLDDFTEFYFDDYINEFEVLLFISNKPKKELKKIRFNIQSFTIFPLQIIFIKEDTTIIELNSKINNKILYDIDKLKNMFYSEYNQLVRKSKYYAIRKSIRIQRHLDFLIQYIKVCPYCSMIDFSIFDEWKEHKKEYPNNYNEIPGYFGKGLKCKNCNNTIYEFTSMISSGCIVQ